MSKDSKNRLGLVLPKGLVNISLIVGVLLISSVWRVTVIAGRPAHLLDMAAELGSVAEFWGKPSPNHAGNHIVFQQSTEGGIGIFWASFSSDSDRQRKLLYEHQEKNFDVGDFKICGWSPDDSQFVFLRRTAPDAKREIVICDGKSGVISAVVSVDRAISQLTWLSPQALVFADDHQELYKVDKLKEDKWGHPQPFKKVVIEKRVAIEKKKLTKEEKTKLKEEEKAKTKLTREQLAALPPITSLAALTPDTVAYQCEQAIWSWTFGAKEPQKIWEAESNVLLNFTLDAALPNQLRLCLTNNDEILFAWYSLDSQRYTHEEKVEVVTSRINQLEWFNGEGNAYMANGSVHVQNGVKSKYVSIPFEGGLNSLAGGQHELFIFGSRSGEPTAIWKLKAGPTDPVCVVSNTMASLKYAKPVAATREVITNSAGGRISFQLWSPPCVTAGKKYPLLIGKMHGRWSSYPEAIANGGAYVVSFGKDEDDQKWNDNTLELLSYLKTKLSLDEDNLYLVGISGYTSNANQMLASDSTPWKGLILFSPAALPDANSIGAHRLFIDYGTKDPLANAVKQFCDNAAKAGVAVTLSEHENSGHIYRSVSAIRARDEAVMKFIFGL